MRQLLINTTAAIVTFTASQAYAADQAVPNWYVGLSGGLSYLDDTQGTAFNTTGVYQYKKGGEAALALGYILPGSLSDIRLEAEGGWHANKTKDFNTAGGAYTDMGWQEGFSYMANAYFDLRNSTAFTPYAGAGIGGVYLVQTTGQGKDNVLAYQFMGGVSYMPAFMPQTEWNVGYRYFTNKGATYDNTPQGKISGQKSSNAEIGMKYHF